jgi:hypothetical protein
LQREELYEAFVPILLEIRGEENIKKKDDMIKLWHFIYSMHGTPVFWNLYANFIHVCCVFEGHSWKIIQLFFLSSKDYQ